MQKVLVLQRDSLGQGKIAAVGELAEGIEIKVVTAKGPFLPIVDDPQDAFPPGLQEMIEWCDIAVDHLYHADLTGYVLEKAKEAGKPLVVSGRKVPGAICPTTCCTLAHMVKLGEYGEKFGSPEVKVTLNGNGAVSGIEVARGAPCGATWRAAERIIGMKAGDASARFGLETQFFCFAKANPNVFLKNPLHVAGEIHAAAMDKALAAAGKSVNGEKD